MNQADYFRKLSPVTPTLYHNDEGDYNPLIDGELLSIGYVLKNLTDSLRKSFLDLPVVGRYTLIKWDKEKFTLMRIVHGLETGNSTLEEFTINRPLIYCHPSEYEALLINSKGEIVQKNPYWYFDKVNCKWKHELTKPDTQENLF